MESETSARILQEIDGILAAIGQKDHEVFRGNMQKASTLLANLAIWSGKVASMSRDNVVALAQQPPELEQERILRLLIGMRESLPRFGYVLVRAAQIFPPDQGGRPKSFEDRETMRQACSMVLALVAWGKRESQAKKIAAKKFEVSYQTMHRTWERRAELMEQSFEEFFIQFLKSLSAPDVVANPESGSLAKSPAVGTASSLDPGGPDKPQM